MRIEYDPVSANAVAGNVHLVKKPILGIFFWAVCLISLISGAFVFRRIKPGFAEVL